jgi:hypothetical protein
MGTSTTTTTSALIQPRIYWIIVLYWSWFLYISSSCFGQIPLQANDYRTISSGNYELPTIWETWTGSSWVPALTKPNATNNIFIDAGHEVRLTANEAANNVYLFSAASPGRKLNLQSFDLNIFGALRAMNKIDDIYVLNNVTNALIDWIYPETGQMVFRGTSRVVVDRASWSANTTNSRYTVVFDPDPGETLIVNSGFKANTFIIRSGTVQQTVNTVGIPACSTFSFNNQAIFNGSGPYGSLIVESGATLISDCQFPLSQILRRSETIPAALFHLQEGGRLILTANQPTVDAALFLLDGEVVYRSNFGTQSLMRTTFTSSGNVKSYTHLTFENSANKLLIDSLFLSGDLSVHSGPQPQDGPTFFRFQGGNDQYLTGLLFDYSQAEIVKTGGTLFTQQDMRIRNNMYMRSGNIDFNEYRLFLNTSGAGIYQYQAGSWTNLSRLIYNQLPSILGATNATFPFWDSYQGGTRSLQLLGSSPGGIMEIEFTEIPGANWDPGFSDIDGTPILYQLRSHFTIYTTLTSTDSIEMRISAVNLIVADVDDLRIVADGEAAPGSHLNGIDPSLLWSRRSLAFSDLPNNTFTVGSFRVLSILPVQWIGTEVKRNGDYVSVSWQTASEKDNAYFLIQKSIGNINRFLTIGTVLARGDSEIIQSYTFNYEEKEKRLPVYYRIQQVDHNGTTSLSSVFRLAAIQDGNQPKIKFFPNPYERGPFHLQLPKGMSAEEFDILLYDSQGNLLEQSKGNPDLIIRQLEQLKPGLYILVLISSKHTEYIRVLKK